MRPRVRRAAALTRALQPLQTLAKPCFGESGARYAACYLMTAWILFFSTYRDIIFHRLIQQQPKAEALTRPELAYVGYALVGVGQVFVWSSFLKLGITGTFLGDYCGILMSQRVTGFPFNVLDNPMCVSSLRAPRPSRCSRPRAPARRYVGSSLSFMGTSLLSASAVGLALSAEIFLCYHVAAAYFEGPFTTAIYSRAAAAAAKKKK